MLIYLYGPDSYRKNEKLKEVLGDYKKKHSNLAIERFNILEKDALILLSDFIKAGSLFDNMKLGIIEYKTLLSKKDEKEFITLLKDNIKTKDIFLVILSDKKPAKEFNFLIKAPVVFQEFEVLKGVQFMNFLKKEFKNRGLEFDEGSRNLLAGAYAGDSWGLIMELDKLSLLNNKKITQKTLEQYIDLSLPIDVFKTLGEISRTSKVGDRLYLLENLFKRSGDLAMIFNFLSVFVKGQEDKKKMADYDVAIKTGKLGYEEVLTELMLG